jgi:hypothetical protein
MIIREEHGSIRGMYFLLVFFLLIVEHILLPIRLSSGFSDETDPEQGPRDLAARLVGYNRCPFSCFPKDSVSLRIVVLEAWGRLVENNSMSTQVRGELLGPSCNDRILIRWTRWYLHLL